jgi:molybdopterin converting factor small subunit
VTITILLFASAADLAARGSVTVEVPPGAAVADVADALRQQYPQLSNLLAISRWALQHEFVPLTASVYPDKELALIPPVSGG